MDQFWMALYGRLIMASSSAAHSSLSHGPQQQVFACMVGMGNGRLAEMVRRNSACVRLSV